MKNKYIIIIIIVVCLAALVLSGIVVFFFLSGAKNNISIANNTTTTNKNSTEPTYPKVDKYEIPILMYHYVRDSSGESELGKKLSVSPGNFDIQLKWIKDSGYETILISDLADTNRAKISKIYSENKKPIAITFDDGYKDAYSDAFPVLKKHGMTGTFYIIRDSVGGGAYMNQAQIDELEKAGNEIGSHTISHLSLDKIGEDDQRTQIFDSKFTATSFCYPSGKYNDTTVKLVKEAGYITAVTTKTGIANNNSNLFELPRVRVEDGDGITLKNKIQYAEEINK